jgi:hemerythrin
MSFEWTPDLSVGIGDIDSQHREFINRADKFISAVEQGRGADVLAETVKFFMEYAEKHFMTEEMFMLQFGYPEMAPHKKLHNGFREYMEELAKRIAADPGAVTQSEAKEKIADWFIHHIKNVDTRLGVFLKKKMV